MKKYYGANPFGRPLDKKSNLDKIINKYSSGDTRTPTPNSTHKQEIFFNKVFK